MKCPRCGSDNVTYSHRRGMEKILRYFWPRVPYRCKECWTRFWKLENILQAVAVTGGIIGIAIIILLAVWYKGREVRPDDYTEPVRPAAEQTAAEDDIREMLSKMDEQADTQISEQGKDEQAGTEAPDVKPDVKPDIEPDKPDISPDPISKTEPVPEQQKKTEAKHDVPGKETRQTSVKKQKSYRILKGIRLKAWGGYFKMTVNADGPIRKYKAFPLNNPSRLVINISGKWKSNEKQVKEVKSDLVSRIRIGEHPDYLTIVLDLKKKQVPTRILKESPEGLALTLRK